MSRPYWFPLVPLIGALVAIGGTAACAPTEESSARSPADDSVEAGFARDMAEHHAQAVDMASRIQDRTTDPTLQTMARDIVLTQQNQIGRMQAWLELWGLPQARGTPPMVWMGGHSERMPGMASPQEIENLSTQPEEQAERSFLELMVRHHRGGIQMATEALARSQRPEVRRLAQSIVDGQQAEIEAMERMLETRGAPSPDGPKPHE